MSEPRVSIITPFFNAEVFFNEAIESVLSQTFGDWELFLVDDGSSDGSTRIAHAYAEKHPARIFYFEHDSHANLGVAASREMALHRCRGEFVALLDADDVWLPQKLAEQVHLMRAHPEAGLLYGLSEYWFDWEMPSAEANFVPKLAESNKLYLPPELAKLTYPLGPHGSPCPSDLIFRRESLLRVGGLGDDFRVCEDLAFLARIFLNEPVYVADKVWSKYRRHPNSVWSVAQTDGEETRWRAQYLVWLKQYLIAHCVEDAEIWKLHRAAMRKWGNPRLVQVMQSVRRVLRPLKRWFR